MSTQSDNEIIFILLLIRKITSDSGHRFWMANIRHYIIRLVDVSYISLALNNNLNNII